MSAGQYYRETIERQRRGRRGEDNSKNRRCGGYLAWKFNESWPQIYSAKVDFFLKPLIPYYAIRRAFVPVLLSFEVGSHIWAWVVNDSPDEISGRIEIRLFHIERNETTRRIVRDITVGSDQSVVVSRLDQDGIGTFRRDHLLFAEFTNVEGEVIARCDALTDIERRIVFPDAQVKLEQNGAEITVTTDKYAYCVVMAWETEDSGCVFADNYFNLLPGEEAGVRLLGDHWHGEVIAKPFFSTSAAKLRLTAASGGGLKPDRAAARPRPKRQK